MDWQRLIGIDIGGTKIAAALVTNHGRFSNLIKVDTPVNQGPPAIIQAVIRLVESLCKQAQEQQLSVLGIGIGSAGQIDVNTGTVIYAVETMPGWTGTILGTLVENETGLPVIVDNDVNAMALGEMCFGAGRGYSNTLYAAVGTGIGGAVILNGQLWHGINWSAGELGHILVDYKSDRVCNCGATGHLEAYAAGPAIAKTYYQRKGLSESTDLRPVVVAAVEGDALAREALAEGAKIMGAAMAGLAAVLNPEALILGGGVALLGELWWDPFEAAVRANPMPAARKIVLKRAELGNEAVLIGAAKLIQEKIALSKSL